MLELNAKAFLGAMTQLRAVQALINSNNVPDKTAAPVGNDAGVIRQSCEILIDQLETIGARSALRAAYRLAEVVNAEPIEVSFQRIAGAFGDIESRFSDFLDDIHLFAIPEDEAAWYGFDSRLHPDVSFNFPSTVFEFSEAGKCIALGRHTAAMFHAMRVLEVGVHALAKRLHIPDPITAAQRNWAMMLREIQGKIDGSGPRKERIPLSEGSQYESVYVTLDSVRNPWRNANDARRNDIRSTRSHPHHQLRAFFHAKARSALR